MTAPTPDVSFVKPDIEDEAAYLHWREQVANVPKHWVRTVTACNSKCLFCLDSDTPRNVYLSEEDVKAEILRGRAERDAWKIILSGGEASLHPLFTTFIRYAHEVGYGRVQTVTNGWRYADRAYYEQCVQAGLGEITFSLHGHTAELHNRLTQHKGSFERIVTAIRRAARDPRVICSIDVVINQGNVAVLDRIVQLGIKLGVTEFDLLHVIPQAAAFDHRDQMFYDPRDHLDVLRRVFRLNRHPRFVVWTNRFPPAFLEGMEDLIQDPHKQYDELEAIHHGTRRQLDTGEPLDCRQPERCVHCFNEPLCTTVDRVVERQNEATWEVWDVDADLAALRTLPEPLPYGMTRVGLTLDGWSQLPKVASVLPDGVGVVLRGGEATPIPSALPAGSVLVATTAAQCEAWLTAPLPTAVDEVEIHLTRDTAAWILAHAESLQGLGERVRLHQPSYEHLADAQAHDIREPRRFFQTLARPLRVSGLPACLAVGTTLIEARPVLLASVFDPGTGRPTLPGLAHHHIVHGYLTRSTRCADCVVSDRCDGVHLHAARDRGLRQLQPLTTGEWAASAHAQLTARYPSPPARMATGRSLQAPAPSLPGYAMPTAVSMPALQIVEEEREVQRAARRAAIRAELSGEG